MRQQELALIPYSVDGTIIEQRGIDGYINATAMCRAVGKLFNDYARLSSSTAYARELETDTRIPISELIQSVKGGNSDAQGTWVHPKVALHLAQWLSPRFAVQVTNWVYDWMTGRVSPSAHRMPYHLRRYLKNRAGVRDGHFSMLSEMIHAIIAPMEEAGYILPERLLPDISSGKMFSSLLQLELGVDTDAMPSYDHYFEDGRVVRARAYPEEYLPAFRKFMRERWIPEKSISYFRQKDPEALQYLQAIYPKAIAAEV
jgi:hypothetical protein